MVCAVKKFLLLVLSLACCLPMMTKYHTARAVPDADSMLRLHVVAQSNSESDQAQKLLVRDAVLELLADDMRAVSSRQEAQQVVSGYLDEIRITAKETLARNGSDADVSVSLSVEDFPSICYNGQIVPKGEYLALRIVLGDGKGKNWWCVLFPPLCYGDVHYDETVEVSSDTPQELEIRWFIKEWLDERK